MLAKKYRLPVQEFFRARPETVTRTKHFLLKSFPNKGGASRLGVVISKAIIPKATGRHKLTRAIFDYFRTHQGDLPKKEFLLVLNAPAPAKEALFEELGRILSLQKP